jgi:hypothetical protein
MVSTLRLARRRDIVSQLPEKIHSTATTDPTKEMSINDPMMGRISCEHTRNGKHVPCEMREVGELQPTTGPPFQWITSIEALTRELEVLLYFIRERLREISVVGCEINLLRGAV